MIVMGVDSSNEKRKRTGLAFGSVGNEMPIVHQVTKSSKSCIICMSSGVNSGLGYPFYITPEDILSTRAN